MEKNQELVLRGRVRETPAIDVALIEEAIQKSPSGNNAQPFSFRWNENTLVLTYNQNDSKQYLNRGQHATYITLGCALASIQVAAEAQSLKAKFDIPNLEKPTWEIEIRFEQTIQKGSLSNQTISQRQTYRGTFQKSPLSIEAKMKLESLKFENTGIKIATADELTPAFKNYIVQTENYIWSQAKATKEFLDAVQFHGQNAMSLRSLGITFGKALGLRFMSFFPSLPSLMVKIDILKKIFAAKAIEGFQNSHFMMIHASNLDTASLINAGQLAMRAWLTLEQEGYKAQPMSSSSITLIDAAKALLPLDTTEYFLKIFNIEGPRALEDQFHLTPPEQCVWIFRFGKA